MSKKEESGKEWILEWGSKKHGGENWKLGEKKEEKEWNHEELGMREQRTLGIGMRLHETLS